MIGLEEGSLLVGVESVVFNQPTKLPPFDLLV